MFGRVYYPDHVSWNHSSGEWDAYLDDFNDSSLVFSVITSNTFFLFTGDAGCEVLEKVMFSNIFKEDFKKTNKHIVKVPHHGSQDGACSKLFKDTHFELAVVSVGTKNQFKHPDRETLNMYRSIGTRILRTDIDGNIEFVVDSEKVRVKSWH